MVPLRELLGSVLTWCSSRLETPKGQDDFERHRNPRSSAGRTEDPELPAGRMGSIPRRTCSEGSFRHSRIPRRRARNVGRPGTEHSARTELLPAVGPAGSARRIPRQPLAQIRQSRGSLSGRHRKFRPRGGRPFSRPSHFLLFLPGGSRGHENLAISERILREGGARTTRSTLSHYSLFLRDFHFMTAFGRTPSCTRKTSQRGFSRAPKLSDRSTRRGSLSGHLRLRDEPEGPGRPAAGRNRLGFDQPLAQPSRCDLLNVLFRPSTESSPRPPLRGYPETDLSLRQ